MNICHIITRLIIGGAQENTLLTCAGLHERGHRVTLITGPDAGPEGHMLDQAFSADYEVRIVPSLRRAIQPLTEIRAWRDLKKLLAEIQPDVVHTHSSKAGILGRIAAHTLNIPTIIHTIHGMSFNRTQLLPTRWLYRLLEKHCAPFTDRIICVADAMTAQAVAAGLATEDKFLTVYSGMQTDWYTPDKYDRQAVRKSWGVSDNEIVIGTIARLFRNKGYEQLIPAMADAARQVPELRFVWVGDGAQRAEYERRLETLGIRSRVHLTGLVEPEQVAELIAGMDTLVHASQWEGLPRAAVQALLMEKPAVSFDIDGAPEVVIPDRTGMLVPLNDVNKLTEAMVKLARNKAQRETLGQEGRRLCLEKFDHNRMVDAIEMLYKKMADCRG